LRQRGQITVWNDDRGFGFITPEGGGERVFVHVKGFKRRTRRPAVDDRVTYQSGADGRGRVRAERVAFAGSRDRAARTRIRGLPAAALALGSLGAVTASAVLGFLPAAVPALYAGASVVTFLAYARDKSAARNDRWRTKESTLHILGLAGGWPGGLAAQRLLRHKSRKRSFQTVFWLSVIANLGGLVWLHTPGGSAYARSFLRGALSALS
jgi:uncharacterized membrane protein YsdA (DUF1294 family)/cold shock CspA family protein